jgi:hypothetical protein
MTSSGSGDRRDPMLQQRFIAKLREELQHAPALALTIEQTSRLADIPIDMCRRLVGMLAADGVVTIRPDGRIVAVEGDKNLR